MSEILQALPALMNVAKGGGTGLALARNFLAAGIRWSEIRRGLPCRLLAPKNHGINTIGS